MKGKVKNPARKCRICGGECEKTMRYCKACAREVKEIRERRRGNYFQTAPRRGEPEVLKPPRQKTGPSPANLEGTR